MAKIGIDFGTTYSTVSYVNNRTQEAVPIRFNGKEKIPTMLYFPEDGGRPIVGEAAYAKYDACQNAETSDEADVVLSGIVTGLKRNMSRNERLAIPGIRSITYAEAIAIFFKYIGKDWGNQNQEVTQFTACCQEDGHTRQQRHGREVYRLLADC